MEGFESAKGAAVVEAMIRAIQENKGYLSEVDGLIGDGDHGTNMNKGFTMCQERLMAKRAAGEEPGLAQALEMLGDVLFNEIGGSMGPIYGTVFMDMAGAAQGQETIGAETVGKMLDAALEGLWEILDAQVGDKTLIDALAPARDAYRASHSRGETFAQALEAMKASAAAGRDATKDMAAKYGRSARLGERSRGVLDAGAVSCALLLAAFADAARGLL